MLDAYAATLAAIDWFEEAMVAAYDYSRVSLPDTGSPPIHAAAATITRRLGLGLAARHLAAELRRRQAPFARAAEDLSTAGADLLPPSPSACGPRP